MNIFSKVKVQPLHVYIILGAFLVAGIAAAAEYTKQDDIIFENSDDGFKNVILDHATDIENAVNNMLAGRESPADVLYLIRVEYRGTLHDSKYSAEEIEINEKYKSFLNEAYSVVTVYSQGQTPDLSKMKAAKAELY